MNPKQLPPRQRIQQALERLSHLPMVSPRCGEISDEMEEIENALEEMRDPPTLPEIAALSGKRAWWWEGFIVGTILSAAVCGLTLATIGLLNK